MDLSGHRVQIDRLINEAKTPLYVVVDQGERSEAGSLSMFLQRAQSRFTLHLAPFALRPKTPIAGGRSVEFALGIPDSLVESNGRTSPMPDPTLLFVPKRLGGSRTPGHSPSIGVLQIQTTRKLFAFTSAWGRFCFAASIFVRAICLDASGRDGYAISVRSGRRWRVFTDAAQASLPALNLAFLRNGHLPLQSLSSGTRRKRPRNPLLQLPANNKSIIPIVCHACCALST